MRLGQPNVLWPLRLIAALSVIGPALIFGYAIWSTTRAIEQKSSERIERALDILQEHSLKALQTVERTLAEANEVLRGLDDDAIRADEAQLSRRLGRTQAALPQIQAIWAFDAAGHPLVASTVTPVPAGLDNSDRDYFRAQVAHDAGTFIGDIVQAKLGGFRFFVMSARRPERPGGGFNGIVAISVLPEHFREFYGRLSHGVADSFGLIRSDGAFLARFPAVLDRPERLDARSAFLQGVMREPARGAFTAVSSIDGVERRIGYRRVPGYPVYVQAGIEIATMGRELRSTLLGHLAFGLPATLALGALSVYALRRTERFQAEVARREVAEATLKQAQRLEAVGRLTGGVAHDFNNLLMVVSGNVERLKRYPAADERQRRALDAIEAAARRGASLTGQLLSFSRRQTHAPVPVDLVRRLPQFQDMLRSSLRGDIAVELALAPDLWLTKVDLTELELAILNLAVNARDAMPGGGRLTLAAQNVTLADSGTVGLTGEFVALSLTDSGSGIPPDVLARVFEPFFTTKEVGKGTGLGLSQVYGFATQSGGTATVASQPGRGTTVTLYLPRTTDPAQPAPDAQPPREPVRRRQDCGRILLVDDNAEVAEITRSYLEELGYSVVKAHGVETALEILRAADDIGVVLSDIVMPGRRNGLDLARHVRMEYAGQVDVLLATGYSDVAQAAAAEGFAILRKPFDGQQVREALDRVRQRPALTVVG
ncbi:MAG: response regulator [Methylobacterium sp.]|uniref:ATP-binding protein n=1 Tax=Methylobacterium sp. TaxID=409 RepID=UPI0025869BF8|nr:ATP-binding protein [Methylobacterium sp.]MBY0298807.1 response regulator [Methylobacterium sp.]